MLIRVVAHRLIKYSDSGQTYGACAAPAIQTKMEIFTLTARSQRRFQNDATVNHKSFIGTKNAVCQRISYIIFIRA